MKKIYILEELDCAHCATKIEEEVSKVEGVNTCNVSFLSRKMTLNIEEDKEKDILKEAKKIIKKLEPDVEIIEK